MPHTVYDFTQLPHGHAPLGRGVYCNRTLNLRSVDAIGYDMDYTLVHYDVVEWERVAYHFLRSKLAERGYPVEHMQFDPDFVVRGLVIDTQLGNIVKANRFGYVKRAAHGTRMLSLSQQRAAYARISVELSEPRWAFLNTFFSLSEACMLAQLVDALDEGRIGKAMGYADLYAEVRYSIDQAHMEGELKARILADPARFVVRDPEIPATLLGQKKAGKKLMLITNSEWDYTQSIMEHAFVPFLPEGMGWRDLFDLVVVSARKPGFFLRRNPLFEITGQEGLLRPSLALSPDGLAYLGGCAEQVEEFLGVSASDILYVGDHLYSDVHVSKGIRRWRTALVVREIEAEVEALGAFAESQQRLTDLMAHKARLELQLARRQWAELSGVAGEEMGDSVHERVRELDALIAPLAVESGRLCNRRWGPLMRTGNDKSHLARQVERHSDIYMSRVSNLAFVTPFAYLRSHRGTLPHDTDILQDGGD